jgi:uncharacterized protein (TIGR03437 family)
VSPLPYINIGSDSIPAAFAGLATGQVGLYQVNFTLPGSVPQGITTVPLGFRYDNFSEPVLLAIQ